MLAVAGQAIHSNAWTITGGLGALGLVMAHWACQQAEGAKLSLLSRGGRADGQSALASLVGPSSHGHVEICKADVSCYADAGLAVHGRPKCPSATVLHAGEPLLQFLPQTSCRSCAMTLQVDP